MHRGFTIRGAKPTDVPAMQRLHAELRYGRRMNRWRRLLFRRRSQVLLSIALSPSGDLAGFQMFVFREGEHDRGIVHGAFTGVRGDARGIGLATAIRRHAARHFAASGLRAISMQIDRENMPSVRSALKIGYEIVGSQTTRDGGEILQLLLDLGSYGSERSRSLGGEVDPLHS